MEEQTKISTQTTTYENSSAIRRIRNCLLFNIRQKSPCRQYYSLFTLG